MTTASITGIDAAPTTATAVVEFGCRRKAGCHHGDLKAPRATRPSEGLAKVSRTGAYQST
jgi:hypothetical protein